MNPILADILEALYGSERPASLDRKPSGMSFLFAFSYRDEIGLGT